MPRKSCRASQATDVSGKPAAHMPTAEAAMASTVAAMASARRGMSSAALGADRHYQKTKEERREGNEATHGLYSTTVLDARMD